MSTTKSAAAKCLYENYRNNLTPSDYSFKEISKLVEFQESEWPQTLELVMIYNKFKHWWNRDDPENYKDKVTEHSGLQWFTFNGEFLPLLDFVRNVGDNGVIVTGEAYISDISHCLKLLKVFDHRIDFNGDEVTVDHRKVKVVTKIKS